MKIIKIIGWIVATPFILVALFALIRFLTCGPDRAVVRVVTPVGKIIADEILKNGIPKSLKDIKGLSYELEGCKRSEVYKTTSPTRKVQTKKEAEYVVIRESCYFKKKNNKYDVDLWYVQHLIYPNRSHGDLELFNKEVSSGIQYKFKYSKDNNKIKLSKRSSGSNPYSFDQKNDGFCSNLSH